MVELIAKSPCEGLLPLTVGGCSLAEVLPAAITSITPARGQEKLVSAALKKSHGVAFPAPGRATGKDGARCIWFGPGQAVLLGPAVAPIKGAALSEQSDGWAVMRLSGANATDALARLVPIDLRAATFKRGHTARTLLFHVSVSITRTGANAFDIMVFRSMAATAVHELGVALRSVAAQSE
ncbi:MAG: sarcosine oxidase subunit gamma [Marinosulfonomonas sp.]|nr:sarcosine oxidase subunit gamma [Marinosulfonomonas sp.]